MREKGELSKEPLSRLPEPEVMAAALDKIREKSQKLTWDYVKNHGSEGHFNIPDPGVVSRAFLALGEELIKDPKPMLTAQAHIWADSLALWQKTALRMMGLEVKSVVADPPRDKRFQDEDWANNVLFDFIKQSYLLTSRQIQNMVADVDGLDEQTAKKLDFYTRLFVESMAPSNFVTSNPQIYNETLQTGGGNLINGLANLLDDLEQGKGMLRVRMTDLEKFSPGKNVAATPGKVVYQNELMQLIQYTPTTDQVFKRPLLIFPPWINKYYILDLRSKNSFIKWAVDQGFTVFIMSWINPDETLANKKFEDYMLEGPIAALDAIEKATGESEVNAVGYCIGGTLLSCTLAWLSVSDKKQSIKSATLFTTMLDYTEVGELSVYLDEEQIELVEKHMAAKGYLEGTYMAQAFNLLRANDLHWSFVVNNYLLGKEPFPFDLLYWNSDSTRMPAKMHSFYLRNFYQYNRLKDPGGITLAGTPIDLGSVKTPIYFLSTHDDHIAPWRSTYAGTRLFSGPVKFVLGGSGHIAGVINPASSNKYGYRTNTTIPNDPEEWLKGAKSHEGSWWPDWFNWVKGKAGTKVKAREPGEGKLPIIEDAPGSYVKIRI
ncbi:MAG: class I poly(R)-hydroxyalkanoic acid synthase [Magnetococcales bacterium]|nr:class I poly(R)-hydroxyalkanoic acid synthase [Magnetococcales bacterium]